ncbi:MAG: bifunctional ornithine acetyltransferase/N-acetylglutamate synthase, partial [Methanobrevibacter sp.]|nr:bifunctional ornithine acetyltransferase/N-acetylglutamate synthase [Methanobrevibacter sp.]
QNENVNILVNLYQGDSEATAWGCDLTYDYVKINAEYTT